MKRIMGKIHTIVCLLYLKIRYRNSFIASFNQRQWEKDLLFLIKKGKIQIQKNVNFRRHLQIRVLDDGFVSIGEYAVFNTNVSITCRSEIRIGHHSKIANNVVITDHDHDYHNKNVGYITEPISIGDYVWIGANCVVLKGVTLGDNVVVAAGSVVNSSLGYCSDCIVAGNPARVIKKFNEERTYI